MLPDAEDMVAKNILLMLKLAAVVTYTKFKISHDESSVKLAEDCEF